MHSLSCEMLNTKVIHLKSSAIMSKKFAKLMRCSKGDLISIAIEVRQELGAPRITDVLVSGCVTKFELVQDIMAVIRNSVSNNFKTILSSGKENR